MEKLLRKHGNKIALVLLIILFVTFIGIFAIKDNFTFGNASAEATAVSAASGETEDYSLYTDNPLPDSQDEIKYNIEKYVPTSLFNKTCCYKIGLQFKSKPIFYYP